MNAINIDNFNAARRMILSMSEKAKKESVSMRVDGRNLVELRAMAESDERSVSFLIDKAIAEFLERRRAGKDAARKAK